MRSPFVVPFLAALALASNRTGSLDGRAVVTPQAFASSSDGALKLNIDGFGAAVTDATVAVFNKLPASKLSELLNQLLTPAGANFAMTRHTIASSDLSADPSYSYDDNNGKPDPSLSSFNLGDRGTAMARLLARMKGIQSALTILGSPWSAPGWMKLNGVLQGTTDRNNLNPAYVSQFAQYFVNYIQAYQNLGAPIDAITIQNEPLMSKNEMPTMYVFADESGNLIQQNIGPALRAAGLNTGVWAYDHNTDRPEYPEAVLDKASQYITGVAWHCYESPNWRVLTDFHNRHPNVKQYMTECWTPSRENYSWRQAADFTMGPLQNWASGVMAWGLGTDNGNGPYLSGGHSCKECRGLVTIDAVSGSYQLQIDYYMMAQFSKFMPKGAKVLSGTGSYSFTDGSGIERSIYRYTVIF